MTQQIPQGAPGGGKVESTFGGQRESSFTEEQEAEIFQHLEAARQRFIKNQGASSPAPEDTLSDTPEALEVEPVEFEAAAREEAEPGEHTTAEFEKLTKIGYATRKFEIGGNKIVLRTLTQGEEFSAMEEASNFPEAVQGRAFSLLCLCLSLMTVNGKRWFTRSPLSKDDSILQEKFEALTGFYRPVVQRMLEEYNSLNIEMTEKALYARKK